MMKNTFYTLLFFGLCHYSFGQNTISFNRLNVDSEISIETQSTDTGQFLKSSTSMVFLEESDFFQDASFDPDLFRPVSDYGMIIVERDYFDNGTLDMNLWDIGKPIFEFNSEVYANDLSRYIQRPPDIMLLCPLY